MKTIRRHWLIGASILVLFCAQAHAGSDFGSEGGGNQPCKTGYLPANIWSLVSYDNAGQPCLTKPDADQTCDSTATWNWQTHGTVIVTNQPRVGGVAVNTATIQMQLWVGNGGGACYGGSKGPIICDNQSTHYLQESETYYFPGKDDGPSDPVRVPAVPRGTLVLDASRCKLFRVLGFRKAEHRGRLPEHELRRPRLQGRIPVNSPCDAIFDLPQIISISTRATASSKIRRRNLHRGDRLAGPSIVASTRTFILVFAARSSAAHLGPAPRLSV
jgi:hypothetical protein